MKVEFVDLKSRYLLERREILKTLDKVLKKGHLVLTNELEEFEQEICKYTKRNYCLGLNSGTDALMMSLWSLGIGKGDEVITSPTSFIATVGAITHVGAKPVFVDVKEDFNIDEEKIVRKINKKTKAIMPVHWSGRVCNMIKIKSIARKYNLKIIEDAAQGMGSYYNKLHAGSYSDVAAFSTHPLKNLNALGDGGFITTNSKKIYNKIKLFRNHGMKKRDYVESYGVNSRLDVINAEILKMRLKKLKSINDKRRLNANIYRKNLNNKFIKIPEDKKNEINSYVMLLSQAEKRNALQKYLNLNKIQSLIYYGTPLHLHKATKKLGYKKGSLPVAEKLANKVLALPHHQNLSKEQILYVCKKINNFYS
jgi:dTDP-4-amino-4,6-dideoxygalactose transaminase